MRRAGGLSNRQGMIPTERFSLIGNNTDFCAGHCLLSSQRPQTSRALLANRTHLAGRLDKALRRRALHPRQAHVEASRQAEGAAFGTEIDLGIDRVNGATWIIHSSVLLVSA
jgi:hypothetical protein